MTRARATFDARNWTLPAGVVLIVLAAALVWLSLQSEPEVSAGGLPPGMVAVPIAAVQLPAYTEIRLEHLLDPRNGELATVPLPEESILESTIVDPSQLLGRVLGRTKSAGRVFRESDLLPIGTRPGVVAGIPAGKRALRIDASRVNGIVGLQQGDRFDLIATYPIDRGSPVQSVYGNSPSAGAAMGSGTRSRIVAENGAVVSSLETRSLPSAGRAGPIVQEVVLALDPEEIPIVTEALEVAKRIDCVPRSGLPGDAAAGEEADPARPRVRRGGDPVVDVIEGDNRSLRRVPIDRGARAARPGVPRPGAR